jgi:hypothetical protein
MIPYFQITAFRGNNLAHILFKDEDFSIVETKFKELKTTLRGYYDSMEFMRFDPEKVNPDCFIGTLLDGFEFELSPIQTPKTKKSKLTPREKWNKLRESIIAQIDEIDEIDDATPFSASEPKWWMEMVQIRREIRNLKEN